MSLELRDYQSASVNDDRTTRGRLEKHELDALDRAQRALRGSAEPGPSAFCESCVGAMMLTRSGPICRQCGFSPRRDDDG